jgi:hypothetical protein
MRLLPESVLLALLALSSLAASQTPQVNTESSVFRAGRLIDSRSDAVRPNMGILVENGLIRAGGPIARVESEAAGMVRAGGWDGVAHSR